jgi:hypothetical protein
MNKLLALLFCTLLALTFIVGCGGDQSGETQTEPATETETHVSSDTGMMTDSMQADTMAVDTMGTEEEGM